MPAHELHAVFPRGRHHPLRFVQVNRHRLFHDDVFAGASGEQRVLTVQMVGSGDPHDIDVGIGAQPLDSVVRVSIKRAPKGSPRLFADVGGRNHLELRHLAQCFQHCL